MDPAAAPHRDRRHNTEGGLDHVEPGADERGAADGRAPAVFARAIASQADTAAAFEVVDAALDHSSHRDGAGDRRITVSTGAKGKTTRDLVQELQKTVDERAGTPGRPSRSHGGQHQAVVVEASQIETTAPSSERPSPRPWYWQRRNTPITPASCPNRPSSSLTTFDPKSLEIRKLAEMNEWLMAFSDSLLASPPGVTHALFLAGSKANDS
jgi:hypothetical protein